MTYELTFLGSIPAREQKFLKRPIKREHATFEAAKKEALRILASLSNRAAHPAIIYGPGLNKDGVTIA